ncbi:MAG: hypothetical protein J5928_05060 [Firmicutes bacterium]|nr:hypothetical protein [Bacillota bacterium]
MKKVLSILLVLILVFSLAACGGKDATPSGGTTPSGGGSTTPTEEPETPAEPYKIGVATIFSGEQWEMQKAYYENELAPTLNMEFVFSEALQSADTNALINFIDQAYASGCVGIINYLTTAEAVSQGARKCEEYGMYFETQNSKLIEEVADLSHNVGHCGADPLRMAAQYKVLFKDMLSDGQPHSIVLYSCAAVGQMAASHYYSSCAILEAYSEAYGLNFTSEFIDEVINRQEPGEVETGRDDLKIYLYPGIDFDAATVGCQAQLQTGDYDTFASCANFYLFTNAIDEVEKALGKDIRIVGTVNIDDQTKTGFETNDSLGNPVLNAGIINPICPANGINAVTIYNALNGGAEAMKDGGKAVLVGVGPFVCKDAATYEAINKLDRDHQTYVFNSDDIKALMITENPSVTWKDLDAALAAAANIEDLLPKKGL